MKNNYFIEGDIVKIEIRRNNGEVYYAIIDSDELERLKAFKGSWRMKIDNRYGYTYHYVYSHIRNENGVNTSLPLHRFIMKPKHSSQQIDHINHNCLDNRKCNLRIVNGTQNAYNRYIAKNNKSGVPGISWSKQKSKWKAELIFKGQRIFEEYYKDFDEAKRDIELVREAVTKVVLFDTETA